VTVSQEIPVAKHKMISVVVSLHSCRGVVVTPVICLHIYLWINGGMSISVDVALRGRNNELGWMWKEAVVVRLRYYAIICL
jgi:hypothetical protein